MKYLKLVLLSIAFLQTVQCTAQKKKSNSTSTSKTTNMKIQKIELEEMTRGSRRMIVITPTSKNIEVNQNSSTEKTNSSEWSNIQNLGALIDLKKLETYPAPTTKRYYDGAMTATLTITSGNVTYTSQGFDSGRPPKEFADLYFAVSAPFKTKQR